jgi:hypothetical protein
MLRDWLKDLKGGLLAIIFRSIASILVVVIKPEPLEQSVHAAFLHCHAA